MLRDLYPSHTLHTKFAAGRCVNSWRAICSGVGHLGCCVGSASGVSCLTGWGPTSRTSSATGASLSEWLKNSLGQPSLVDSRDMLHRCQPARSLCWCQSRPTDTTNLECVSVVQQLHPTFSAQPLVPETSPGGHRRPIQPPTKSGIERPQLQTSLLLELSRAQRDCAHLETGLFAQISLWCLSFQHHNPVVILSHSAHRCGSRRVGLPSHRSSQTLFTLPLPLPLLLPLVFPLLDPLPSGDLPSDVPWRFQQSLA